MITRTSTSQGGVCRVLSLDGGGAKGFYTLGVLKEIEAMVGRPLCEVFALVYGTSTGAIIAALIALGKSVEEIHDTAEKHAQENLKLSKSLSKEAFGDLKFDAFKTGVGIVATRWVLETPMIFKPALSQAHGRRATFVPGFGCTIADAVVASCSAYPFFLKKTVTTSDGSKVELIDGGYCANNPALYAISDATAAMGFSRTDLRVVSVGVGVYPE